MNEVKRVEAHGIISDLRAFAYTQSPGFAAGRQNGFEVAKAFYHVDSVPTEIRDKVSREMCKSAFGFTAFRVPGQRNKPGYTFMLSATVERTLPAMPTALLERLEPEIVEAYDGFNEIEEGALCEATSVELETSSYELGKITVSHKYGVTYAGDDIHEASDDNILFGVEGTFEDVCPLDSPEQAHKLFVPDPIPVGRITDPVENIVNNVGFWTIVDPFETRGPGQITSFRDAARKMIAITDILTTGELPG